MKYYITGTRRGLGEALSKQLDTVDHLEECDVFINCKFDRFEQVFLLYQAAQLNKRIINISSNTGDNRKHTMYAVYKNALDDLNDRLYYEGIATTSIRFGFFDTPRVADIQKTKMSVQYCIDVIKWILDQPYIVKEITITPEVEK